MEFSSVRYYENKINIMLFNKQDFALLYDRILIRENKKQKYGTQLTFNPESMKLEPLPVANTDSVDYFRQIMGLDSLLNYIKSANAIY